jgi:CRISPR-associated endonuclease Csn1
MKLSIYVNLRSIAWIISEGVEIIAKGIKRVNVDFDNYYEYIAGLSISKRTNRRMKRQARRNLWRYKSRRQNLVKYLTKLRWMPISQYSDKEIYQLRIKALAEKVQTNELGAIFLSLQKKRGYKNMRGLANSEKSDYLNEIKQHEENLKQYRSIAEYLLTKESAKHIIFTRESYEAEFDKICQQQGINDNKLRGLLYFQRPLKRGAISNCTLEKNRKVCHYSHPDFQEFRIWRDVNNIVIIDQNLDELEISNEQRLKWAEKLMKGQNLTKAACCKDLGIKKSTGYAWKSGKQIDGNIVTSYLGSNNFDLWQDIFSGIDDTHLAALIEKKYPNENTEKLLDIDFNSTGWGDYSHKAIMKLLPLLKEGKKLKEAIFELYGIVDMTADICLRNLIVEQHYESYTSLIDAIKKQYDISETAIEISHLLKAGNKSRKAMAKESRAEKKSSQSLTDYQKHLLKLHKEFKGESPYEPDKEITEKELFKNYNVDHIVPKSKLFEHGIINQCLCRKDLNEKKGSLTGIEFARELGIEEKYRQTIDNLQLSERKKTFLLMENSDIPTNYIKVEDYITKCFAKNASYVIPNKILNKYYRDWGLDKYPDNDCRQSLMKCLVLANFDNSIIDYFNNLKTMPNHSIGRYDLKQELFLDNVEIVPYVPRIKYYRKTKYGFIPRHQLHDESIMGERKEIYRNTKGELATKLFYKIRKPIASLTPAMIEKIMDKSVYRKIKERLEGRDHAEAIAEFSETPIFHNCKPIRSVSIRINGQELIKLNRGYVYSSMNHRFEPNNKKVVKLYDYINALNKGERATETGLKKHDIVEYEGNYYFIIGASSVPELRSVFELNAVGIRTNKQILSKCKLVRVNQLGEVKK